MFQKKKTFSNAVEGAFLQPLQPSEGHCWDQMKGKLWQPGKAGEKSPAARGEGDTGLAGPHK